MLVKIFLFVFLQHITCLDNSRGLTPIKGWRPYDHENCMTNEDLIKKVADTLISTGLSQKGYSYIILDKCWNVGREQETKVLIADWEKYPSGIKSLANYIHQKGLKLGLTGGAAQKTCNNFPGIKDNIQNDVKTYLQWGIDLVSFDYCSAETDKISIQKSYLNIQKAFNESENGKNTILMMDYWGDQDLVSSSWAGPFVNSWRVYKNVEDKWKSITTMIDKSLDLQYQAGPGGFNDLGTLLFGNSNLKQHEYIVQYYFAIILKSPLFIGIKEMVSPSIINLLKNDQLLGIHQDPYAIQANRIQKQQRNEGAIEAWAVNLTNNRHAILFFNRGQDPITLQVSVRQEMLRNYTSYGIRDVMNHDDLGNDFTDDILSEELQGHHASLYVLQIQEKNDNKPQNYGGQNQQFNKDDL